MATENKGVMVYLPKEIEEYITEFCTENNITRKDKEGNVQAALGTGIVRFLECQMSGKNPSDVLAKRSKGSGSGLTRDEAIELIQQSVTSHSPSTGLNRDEAIELINSRCTGLTRDEVTDLIQQSVTSHSPSTGLTKEEVLDLIQQSVTSNRLLVQTDDNSMPWAAFHKLLGVTTPTRNSENGKIAVNLAKEKWGEVWVLNSTKFTFTKTV
jgi:hypothetical protein